MLRPAKHRVGRAHGGERGSRQRPQLAAAHLPHRRRRLVRCESGERARVPPGARPACRRAHPDDALPRSEESDDAAGATAFRPHGGCAPGRPRDHPDRGGLVRRGADPLRAGRPGRECRRASLPAIERAAHATGRNAAPRGRHDPAAGEDRSVKDRDLPGRPDAPVPRRGTLGRRAGDDRGARLRCPGLLDRPGAGRLDHCGEGRVVVHVARSCHQRERGRRGSQ